MKRILKFEDGYPNFIRAVKYSSIARLLNSKASTYPIKRRSKKDESSMAVLAYLLAADDISEEIKKGKEAMKALASRIFDKHMEDLRIYVGAYTENFDEVIKDLLSELLVVVKLMKKGLDDKIFFEGFGGYGTFSLAALALGLRGYYVELNPIAALGFEALVAGIPEGLKKASKELIDYLKKECSKYRRDKEYLTFRARFAKCPDNSGEHFPVVVSSYKKGKKTIIVPNHLRWKDGFYEILLSKEIGAFWKATPIYKGTELPEAELRCPNGYEINSSGTTLKKYIQDAFQDESIEFYGRKPKDLPWAYANPVADAYKKSRGIKVENGLKEPYLEGIERAVEELNENREEYKELIPYERLPESIDKRSHGLTEVSRYANYITQIMTPRQLLCYAKIVKRMRENKDKFNKEVYKRLSLLIAKSLQQNVLTRVDHSTRGVKHVSTNQSIVIFVETVELSIPGFSTGSIKNALSTLPSISIFSFSPDTRIDIYEAKEGSGVKVINSDERARYTKEIRIPRSHEVVVINAAVQDLQDDEYSAIWESADIAYLDPPYVDNIPYFDLSYLYYARMKKFYDLPDLEKTREKDLTTSDIEEFTYRMVEAFKGVKNMLKPDGVGVLQFAPNESVDKLDLRFRIIAAILASGLYPLLAANAFSEAADLETKGVSLMSNVKSMLILFANEEAAYEFLKELERNYGALNLEEVFEDPIEFISSQIEYGVLSKFLDALLENKAKPVMPKLEELVPLLASISALILGFLEPERDFDYYYEAIKEIYNRVNSKITDLSRKILEVPKDVIKYAKDDLSFIYAHTLKRGYITADELRLIGFDSTYSRKIKKILEKPESKKASRRTVYVPKKLKEIPRSNLSEALILSRILEYANRVYRTKELSVEEAAERLSKYNSRPSIVGYNQILEALDRYIPKIEDSEEAELANIIKDILLITLEKINQQSERHSRRILFFRIFASPARFFSPFLYPFLRP